MAAIDSRSYCNHLSVRDICIRNYDYEPYKTMSKETDTFLECLSLLRYHSAGHSAARA